ncbi:trimethyllysine dioxygenase [Paxillus involutus ATCC 200175]|uniref:trimethyllysine dioxygenase n=1 Tax=Paxillus involutus ATCC 200175 TaxID=664439 RepID=A0A0C9TQU8_PAXIN|nr:trimethyllysine dioxygenase [Paxillus involutus ATCC 200175]
MPFATGLRATRWLTINKTPGFVLTNNLNATRRPITGGLLGRTQALAKARFITTGASSPRGERLSSQTKNTSRTLSSAAAAEPVSSDQLGYVPDQRPKDDVPMANADDRKVSILWSPQNWSRFHHIWLRDHCRCPSCFHPVTKQRLVNTFEIPPNIKPHHVQASAGGLEVVWPSSTAEYHSSFYPWSWLKAHTYDPPQKPPAMLREKALWGAKIAKSPPTITYAEAMDGSDYGLFKWLSNIDRFGFCFISGVPATPEATEELSERIGFIRETQYGKFWEFTADLSKGDTAYTTMALGAHTDNTYFTDPCGLQLFHLLSHTDGSGGATLLVDGFYVASLLKELHPDSYEILSRVPIPAHAAGEPTALYKPSPPCGYPTLRHDAFSGELAQVRWNNDDRSVMSHLDPSLVEDWYDAIKTWHNLLTSPDSEYWVQLTAGTVLSVDNHRVLHGRSAFDGKRRVCGAYIGVDEYRSKLLVLEEKFDPQFQLQTADQRTQGGNRSIWSPAL